MVTPVWVTERHLPCVILQCYLPPDTGERATYEPVWHTFLWDTFSVWSHMAGDAPQLLRWFTIMSYRQSLTNVHVM